MNSRSFIIDNCVVTKSDNNQYSIIPLKLMDKRGMSYEHVPRMNFKTRREANRILSGIASCDVESINRVFGHQ